MPKETDYELIYEDYAQSANTLFHFMKEPGFLKEILQKRAIVPRYCKENLEYLNIYNADIPFQEVLVLQKCFCDIPFHKLTENFDLKGVGDNYQQLTDTEKMVASKSNTHPDFYGKYAIAFPKSWGEKRGLQPVHYLNEQSQYTKKFSDLIANIMHADNLEDLHTDDILRRLSFIKPLRGIMKRKIKRQDKGELEVEFYKNFFDEQEWRYVPEEVAMEKVRKERIIANPNMLELYNAGVDLNGELTGEQYNALWLKYKFEDVRYIIVPDLNARVDIIRTIMAIPDDMFNSQSDVLLQKSILVSKILVLEEIRKDC